MNKHLFFGIGGLRQMYILKLNREIIGSYAPNIISKFRVDIGLTIPLRYLQLHTLQHICRPTRIRIHLTKYNKSPILSQARNVSLISGGEEYLQFRIKNVEEKKKRGANVYPHKFSVSHSVDEVVALYKHLDKGEVHSDCVFIAGRVRVIRESSKKLKFLDITDNGKKIQIVANLKHFNDPSCFEEHCGSVSRGDIVGVEGVPMRTKAGELSVRITSLTILSPCLRFLPSEWSGLTNEKTIFRQRYLDLLFNSTTKDVFILRAKILSFIRSYFEKLGFLEVETPILTPNAGGANAEPFRTHHNALDMDLLLRIAPELYLKMLVVGGLNKVFEIGKQFRNEGKDSNHNPEFTMCEFYMAYADYYDIMVMTEHLLSQLVINLFNKPVIEYKFLDGKTEEISFEAPFKRIHFMKTLEEKLNLSLPSPDQLHTEESREFLFNLCEERGIGIKPSTPSSKLLDKLFGRYVEPFLISPTFVLDYPQVMSPLAKNHRSIPGLTERFELFVAKKEVCNAYTELNDPLEQRARFQQQAKDKAAGDNEAQLLDESFCIALEYGLPPTGGWGMGIDRLVMLLANCRRIKDVILFPTLKPEHKHEPELQQTEDEEIEEV